MLLYNKLRKQLKLCDIIMIINSSMPVSGFSLKIIGTVYITGSETETISLNTTPQFVCIMVSERTYYVSKNGEIDIYSSNGKIMSGSTTKQNITIGEDFITIKNHSASKERVLYFVFN